MAGGIQLTPESQLKVDGLIASGDLDLRPTLAVIGIGYRKEVALIFDHQQQRDSGLRWPQLSDNPPGKGYKTWKDRHYPDVGILVRTGTLLASMTEEGAEGNITVISRFGATFGTSISYGIYHDSEGPRNGRLPMRNFSDPSDARQEIWAEQIRDSIIHNFNVHGIQVDPDDSVILNNG